MRVLVVDDSPWTRAGVTALLRRRGHEAVAQAGRAEQAPALVDAYRPDALVIQAGMPPTYADEGLRTAVGIRERHAHLGVVVLCSGTSSPAPPTALRALGALLPERLDNALALERALTRVAGGGVVVEPPNPITGARPALSPMSTLTPREHEVLQLLARGLSNSGIADHLNLTTNTVGTHVQHVFDKLGVADSRAENRRVLAVLAYLNG